jgi:hypothetical protein
MRIFAIALTLYLAACSGGPQLPLANPNPVSLSGDLASPPWEALIEAGPDAHKDIDLETLDGPDAAGDEQLSAVDLPTAPSKSSEGAIKTVSVAGVKGAKGSGNEDLTEALKARLQLAGWPVLPRPQNDSMSVSGEVKTSRDPNGEKIEIVWHVEAPDGRLLGDVKQVNIVPEGSVNTGFGEASTAIAEGAATGIFDLVDKYR